MNDKIKELVIKAIEQTSDDEASKLYIGDEFASNYAELIIQECVKICDKVQIKYGQYTFTARICKEDIKQHFGI